MSKSLLKYIVNVAWFVCTPKARCEVISETKGAGGRHVGLLWSLIVRPITTCVCSKQELPLGDLSQHIVIILSRTMWEKYWAFAAHPKLGMTLLCLRGAHIYANSAPRMAKVSPTRASHRQPNFGVRKLHRRGTNVGLVGAPLTYFVHVGPTSSFT